MKALILAAGRGCRLEEVAEGKPKALLEVAGRPILDRQLDMLKGFGIERVCLATGYAFGQLEQRYGARVEYRYNPFYRESNNIVSFLFARDWVDEDLLVLYADLLYEPAVLEAALKADIDVAMVTDRTAVEPGHAHVSIERGMITGIGTDAVPGGDVARHVGISVFSRDGVSRVLPEVEAAVKAGHLHDYYHVALQRLVARGHVVSAIDASDLRWMEIDSPADLERARRDWA